MAWAPISYTFMQYENTSGKPYSGAVLKAYAAGTTTPIVFATDSTGATQVPTITLNALGVPTVSGNAVIPYIDQTYKLALYPDAAAAAANTGAVIGPIDNLSAMVSVDDLPDFNVLEGISTILDEEFAGGATGDGIADDSAAIIAAAASGKTVLFLGSGRNYRWAGTAAFADNTTFLMSGNPLFTLSLNAGANGDRGFWFQPGCTDAAFIGAATINANNLVSANDGSTGTVFCMGKYVYGSGVDATRVARNRIIGPLLINCSQNVGNIKAVGIYGWSEENYVKGVVQSGNSNFAIVEHWGQNISQTERDAGIIPTKTWHPNNNVYEDCSAATEWPNANAFTSSASGRLTYLRCGSNNCQEAFNLFGGDLGYTYAQNLGDKKYPQIALQRCYARRPKNYAVSADYQTSPTGLFVNATLWTSADSDVGGSIIIDDFNVDLIEAETDIPGFAFTCISELTMRNCKGVDTDNVNTDRMVQVFGVNKVTIEDCEFKSMNGILIRNCGEVLIDCDNFMYEPRPDDDFYGVSASTLSGTTTVDGSILSTDTEITLDSAPVAAGAGGWLRYNTGGTNYDFKMESSSFTGITTQTIKIQPPGINIPDGATVTMIQRTDKLTVKGRTQDFSVGVRITGDATAKVGKVILDGLTFLRSGVYDVNIEACLGATIRDVFIDYSGQRTITTDKNGIRFGEFSENYTARGVHFGKNNKKLRYLIFNDDDATGGRIVGCNFESFNAGASNPAAIYKLMSDVIIADDNVYGAGLTPVYKLNYLFDKIKENLTLAVPVDFATPLAAVQYLMGFIIYPGVNVEIEVDAGDYTHTEEFPEHPQASQIRFVCPTSPLLVDADFVITSAAAVGAPAKAAARIVDNTAHLVMLKAKYPVRIKCDGCTPIDNRKGFNGPTYEDMLFWTDNASGVGIYQYSGIMYMNRCSFHGFGSVGMVVTNSGNIRCENVTVSGCAGFGYQSSDGASIKSIGGLIAASCATTGFLVKRGGSAETYALLSKGNLGEGIRVEDGGSMIEASHCVLKENDASGVRSSLGGVVSVAFGTITGNGTFGAYANGGQITAYAATISSNANTGVIADSIGIINFDSGTASSNGVGGVKAIGCGQISMPDSTVSSNTGVGIWAQKGGTVYANNADVTGSTSDNLYAEGSGSYISIAMGSSVNGGRYGAYSVNGGKIYGEQLAITGAASAGAFVSNGGSGGAIDLTSGTLTGSGNRGAQVSNGGNITLLNATVNTNTGNEAHVDIAGNIRVTGTGLVAADTNAATLGTAYGTGNQALIWA